jgi:hypothetical protein
MMIPGIEVPQADVIWDVGELVVAVSHGADGDVSLGAAIGKDDRQGRYYRRAAEILGLLQPVQNSHSELTGEGAYLAAVQTRVERRPLLIAGIMRSNFFKAFIDFLREGGEEGRSRSQQTEWMGSNVVLHPTTINRRLSTVTSWLEELGLITLTADRRVIAKDYLLSDIPVSGGPTESVAKGPRALTAFNGRTPIPRAISEGDVINYWVDRSKVDRAYNKHEELVALTARLAMESGHDVSRNVFVDLFTIGEEGSCLFEMKTNHEGNTVAQVRKAVSQLYEYQYQQDLKDSPLALILESEPTGDASWTIDYLTNARKILPLWEDGDAFNGPPLSLQMLPWMAT